MAVDFFDPLEYSKRSQESHSTPATACLDLGDALAWIFWKSARLKGIETSGKPEEEIGKIRHAILSQLLSKARLSTMVVTRGQIYSISCKCEEGLIHLRIHCSLFDEDFYIAEFTWKQESIHKALTLSRNLLKDSNRSPYGSRDVVFPPDTPLRSMIERKKESVLVEPKSESFTELMKSLTNCRTIYQIQILMEKGIASSLSESEFVDFIQAIVARVRHFSRPKSVLS